VVKPAVAGGGVHAQIAPPPVPAGGQPDPTPADNAQVFIEGTTQSQTLDDTIIEVTHTTTQGGSCTAMFKLTAVAVTMTLNTMGQLDALDSVRNFVPAPGENPGFPQLGLVDDGVNGSNGWHNNIEWKATLAPCVAGLNAQKFDFIRARMTATAFAIPNQGVVPTPPLANQPCAFQQCDDDASDNDEDLVLDPAPDCTLFSVDGPGPTKTTTNPNALSFPDCTPIKKDVVWFGHWAFAEGLLADGYLLTDSAGFSWHSTIALQCDGIQNWNRTNNFGFGNSIGPDGINVTTGFPPLLPTSASEPNIGVTHSARLADVNAQHPRDESLATDDFVATSSTTEPDETHSKRKVKSNFMIITINKQPHFKWPKYVRRHGNMVDDLRVVLAQIGRCDSAGMEDFARQIGVSGPLYCTGDLNHDGRVDALDVVDLLSHWGDAKKE